MQSSSYILDGQLPQDAGLILQPTDLGLAQGLGCFETLWAAADSSPFAAAEHYQRLQASCQKLHLPCPALDELLTHTAQLRQVLGLESQASRIRWTLWQQNAQQSHWLITAQAAQSPEALREPARVQLSLHRLHSQAPLAGHKSTSYAAFSLMLREAKQAGYDEAAYCNEDEELVEAATSNLFFLRQQGAEIRLHTPPLESGCLPGVTRAQVLKLAASTDFPEITLEQTPLKPEALAQFQAAFLTNSQVGIRPIAQLAEQEFDSSFPALIKLQQALEKKRNPK